MRRMKQQIKRAVERVNARRMRKRIRGKEGKANVCGEAGAHKELRGGGQTFWVERGHARRMRREERVYMRRMEGTNLSTQTSSFLCVHDMSAEPLNTPCEMCS